MGWSKPAIALRIAFVFALACSCSLLLSTYHLGIGLSPDSIVYQGMAANFLSGKGLSFINAYGELRPVTHFPPLYPMLLALLHGGLGNFNRAAIVLNVFCMIGSALLLFLVVYRQTHRSEALAALCSAVFLFSPDILQIHSMAWSEPLFIFLELLGLCGVSYYLERRKPLFLAIAACGFGLCAVTRYAGMAWLVGSVVGLAWCDVHGSARDRWRIAFFSLGVVLPAGLWLLRNALFVSQVTDRHFRFHEIALLRQIPIGIQTISSWVLPASLITSGGVVVSILLGILVLKKYSTPGAFEKIMVCLSLSYVGLLLVNLLCFDAGSSLDDRLLSPLHVLSCVGLGLFLRSLPRAKRPSVRVVWAVCLFLLWLSAMAFPLTDWAQAVYDDGQQYASLSWKNVRFMTEIERLPRTMDIYSNSPNAIYLFTQRAAHQLPMKMSPENEDIRPEFPYEMAAMLERIRDQEALLIIFKNDVAWDQPQIFELERKEELRLIQRTQEGWWLASATPGSER